MSSASRFASAVCSRCIAARLRASRASATTGATGGCSESCSPSESPAFAVEALRMHYTQVQPWVAHWSTVGWLIERTFLRGIDLPTAQDDAPRDLVGAHHSGRWVFCDHPGESVPSRHHRSAEHRRPPRAAHGRAGPFDNGRRSKRPGCIGVGQIGDFNQQQLLSLDACMECGRCEDACPATASGKPLSPKFVVIDLRALMVSGGELHGVGIHPDKHFGPAPCVRLVCRNARS